MFRTIADFEERWKNNVGHTQAIFGPLTDASLSQQVAQDHRTLGRMAWHIAVSIPEMMARTGLTFEGITGESPMPEKAADIRKAYDEVALALLDQVKKKWTDADLKVEDEMYGEKWERGFTLYVLLVHEVHHRGQMTVLMRQAGLMVPGIFGPSMEEWEKWGMKAPKV